ncbi:hypothetical protein ACNKHL_26000 [Shigella flexneri]
MRYHRTPELMQKTIDKLAKLKNASSRWTSPTAPSVFNTDLLYTIELGHGLDVGMMAHSAMARKESRGAHQRLDEGGTQRDDVNFLKHTLAFTIRMARSPGIQRREDNYAAAG